MTFSSLLLGGQVVRAAVDLPVATTTGEVSFIAGDGTKPVDPDKPEVVDPTNPDKPVGPVSPVDPTNPEGPAEGGGGDGSHGFNINWVSNFKFSEIEIGNSMSSYALPTTLYFIQEDGEAVTVGNLANFIQVTDNRGTNTGWHVTAQATPFQEIGTEDGAILDGAQLLLNNPIIDMSYNTPALAPEAHKTELDLLATPDSEQMILTAEVGKGQGTWTMGWDAGENMDYGNGKGVQLVVPMKAKPKANTSYVSNITWTLTDAPK